MYWGPDQEENPPKPIFQVTRKEYKPRGRKRLSPTDVDTQRYECFCTKQYRSYPAIYSHVKQKHKEFFQQYKSFGATNMVDTFDPNHGYKIRKLLIQSIQFNSDAQRTDQAPGNQKIKSASQPSLELNMTPIPDYIPKAKVTRNFSHYLEQEQRTLVALDSDLNKRQQESNCMPIVPRPNARVLPDLDFQALQDKIAKTTSPEELKQLTEKTLQKIMKSEYVIDKFQEGKYYEIHQISRLAERLDKSRKIEKTMSRKKQITEQKISKYDQIIYRQREIVDAYEKIIYSLNIEPITNALLGRQQNQMEIEEESAISQEQPEGIEEEPEGQETWGEGLEKELEEKLQGLEEEEGLEEEPERQAKREEILQEWEEEEESEEQEEWVEGSQ